MVFIVIDFLSFPDYCLPTTDFFLLKVYLTSLLCAVVKNGKVLFIPLTPLARAAWALTFVGCDKSKQKHAFGGLASAKTKNTE